MNPCWSEHACLSQVHEASTWDVLTIIIFPDPFSCSSWIVYSLHMISMRIAALRLFWTVVWWTRTLSDARKKQQLGPDEVFGIDGGPKVPTWSFESVWEDDFKRASLVRHGSQWQILLSLVKPFDDLRRKRRRDIRQGKAKIYAGLDSSSGSVKGYIASFQLVSICLFNTLVWLWLEMKYKVYSVCLLTRW